MSHDFPAFALSEEHEALREAVRALADDKTRSAGHSANRQPAHPTGTWEAGRP